MSESDDSRLEAALRGAIRHVRRYPRPYLGAGTATAALVFFAAVLGFRGIGPAALDLAKAAGTLPGLTGKVAASSLKTPHPFAELLAGAVGTGLGLAPLATFRWLSLFAVVAAVPAVAGLGSRFGGRPAGLAAAAVFVALPQVAGAATTVGVAALFVGIWAWFLRLLVVSPHRWWSTLGLWVLGGVLVLLWPPFALWGAVWLVLELRDSEFAKGTSAALEGEFSAPSLPVAIALAPVAVFIVASLLHPALWTAPLEGWRVFGKYALEWTGPVFQFAGESYAEARPPVWIGGALAWWTLPALVVALAALGWIHMLVSKWRPKRAGRLVQRMCLWGLPLGLMLPWLNRGPNWGAIHFTVVVAPFVAVAAGVALARGLSAAAATVRFRFGRPSGRATAWIGAGLAGVLLFATTLGAHPVEGSYYNALAGGFGDAVEQGLPVSRDSTYPVQVLRRARERTGARSIAVLGQRNLVEKYVRLGLLEGVKPAGPPGAADARIRRIGRFESGADSVVENPHALVDLTRGAEPLLEIDGIPIYWLEK